MITSRVLCITVVLLCSMNATTSHAAGSLSSNTRTQQSADRAWKAFLADFTSAVARRDEAYLHRVMPRDFGCYGFDPCDDLNRKNKYESTDKRSLVLRELRTDKDVGWRRLRSILRTDRRLPTEWLPTDVVGLVESGDECGAWRIYFTWRNGRWYFTAYQTGECE